MKFIKVNTVHGPIRVNVASIQRYYQDDDGTALIVMGNSSGELNFKKLFVLETMDQIDKLIGTV